jgi:hypothetical protein
VYAPTVLGQQQSGRALLPCHHSSSSPCLWRRITPQPALVPSPQP